jgi:hypothetical protein
MEEKIIKEDITEKRQSALGVTSLVLGIIAIVIAFIPFLNIISLPTAVVAIVFGIITVIRISVKKAFAISGIILSVLAIVIAFSITIFAINMLDKSGKELDRIAKESLERTKIDVTNVELKIDENSTKVTGKIKNISGEKKEVITIVVPVVDKDTGKLIIDLYGVSRNLDVNGTWDFEVVSNQAVKNAKVDEKNIRVFAM